MAQLNNLFGFLKTIQRALKIKDSLAVSLLSGLLGTLAMDASNLLFWRAKKTEALYGHIAGSIYVRPFRTNQSKNFWLGQITHLITGATLAYPLKLLFQKTGNDHPTLKGAFFGGVTWEIIYGIGQRFGVYSTKPHMTKTHFAELFNNIIYGITTAQALAAFSEPSLFSDSQSKISVQGRNINAVQPIYSDVDYNKENPNYM
ncbi:hypothetical protein [Desulfosporosinus sp. Sb-LF]|uniref:hypothetical protein n=1 Tax=Desulfosporosinus sp. Sb-LF TaxID=2560027 RepID=UPI0018EE9C07|nr:hypothetical protein [Desulfosporosinus sp. Sb-LF]